MNQTMARFIKRKITPTEKKKLDDLLMQLFIFDYQPFSVVQDRGFKAFVEGLNPSYQLPDRKVLSNNHLPALYEACMSEVKEKLKTDAESVCLTTDIGASCVNDGFRGVTADYIDQNFKMSCVLLDCVPLYGSHTADNIKNARMRIILNFGSKKQSTHYCH